MTMGVIVVLGNCTRSVLLVTSLLLEHSVAVPIIPRIAQKNHNWDR